MSVTTTTRRLSKDEERERDHVREAERVFTAATGDQLAILAATKDRSPGVYRWLNEFDRRHRP